MYELCVRGLAALLGVYIWLFPALGSANNFGATRFPFTPFLIENNNNALCSKALDDAKDRFMSTERDTSVRPGAGVHSWLSGEKIEFSADIAIQGEFHRLDLDLDGSGQKQTIVTWRYGHSWRGDNYQAYVFDSPESFEHATTGVQTYRDIVKKGIQYYPERTVKSDKPKYTLAFSIWARHNLFEYNGGYYFYNQLHDFFAQSQSQLGIVRLKANGDLEVACVIQILPTKKQIATFESLPGLASYLGRLRNIGHGGGGSCGTLNSGAWHDAQARAAVIRAGFRPWAISAARDRYYKYSRRMEQFIHDWAYGDVWSYREYQTFRLHIRPAINAFAQYYKRAYGLSDEQAQPAAEQVFKQMTAAHLLVPADHYVLRGHEFRKALLSGYLEAAVEKLLPDTQKLNDSITQFLAAAVENPSLLELLLDAGADINLPNRFGKTALMYAAHMNRPDTVKLLLDRGADPNLVIQKVYECDLVIQRANRYALTYAAENANVDVMQILIGAGAKTDIVDTEGNDLSFYLAKNPFLGAKQKKMTIDELVKNYKTQTGPGFNCKRASTPTEKIICDDKVLSRQDLDMSDAYHLWMKKSNSPKAAKADQKAWLQSRYKQCVSFKDSQMLSCLWQRTRARIRYLQGRISELPENE